MNYPGWRDLITYGRGGLALTIPLPPTVNNGGLGWGDFKARVLQEATAAAAAVGWQYQPQTRLTVRLRLYFPDRRSDVDNRVKVTVDALASALGFDDRAVDELHVSRAEVDSPSPRCEVEIVPINGRGTR